MFYLCWDPSLRCLWFLCNGFKKKILQHPVHCVVALKKIWTLCLICQSFTLTGSMMQKWLCILQLSLLLKLSMTFKVCCLILELVCLLVLIYLNSIYFMVWTRSCWEKQNWATCKHVNNKQKKWYFYEAKVKTTMRWRRSWLWLIHGVTRMSFLEGACDLMSTARTIGAQSVFSISTKASPWTNNKHVITCLQW